MAQVSPKVQAAADAVTRTLQADVRETAQRLRAFRQRLDEMPPLQCRRAERTEPPQEERT